MLIENREKVIKVRLRALIMAVICAISIGLIVTIDLFDNDFLGIEKKIWAFGVLGIYLILSLYYLFLNFSYIYFKVNESILIVRYYSLRPLSSAKNSVEIPLNELANAEIKNIGFGIKKNLILYRKVKNGIAKYPPISLSALSKKEIYQVREVFRIVFKAANR